LAILKIDSPFIWEEDGCSELLELPDQLDGQAHKDAHADGEQAHDDLLFDFHAVADGTLPNVKGYVFQI
jgi:hypothetical protein